MTQQAFEQLQAKVAEKIPQLVAELAEWETGRQYYICTVTRTNKWGITSPWYKRAMSEGEMLAEIRQSKKKGFSVIVSDDETKVTVRRDLPQNEYIIAEYTTCAYEEAKENGYDD